MGGLARSVFALYVEKLTYRKDTRRKEDKGFWRFDILWQSENGPTGFMGIEMKLGDKESYFYKFFAAVLRRDWEPTYNYIVENWSTDPKDNETLAESIVTMLNNRVMTGGDGGNIDCGLGWNMTGNMNTAVKSGVNTNVSNKCILIGAQVKLPLSRKTNAKPYLVWTDAKLDECRVKLNVRNKASENPIARNLLMGMPLTKVITTIHNDDIEGLDI